MSSSWLFPFTETGPPDLVAQPAQICITEVRVGQAQQGRDGLFRGAAEVGLDDVVEHFVARLVRRACGEVNVPRPVLAISHQTFLAEDPEDRPNGRIGR